MNECLDCRPLNKNLHATSRDLEVESQTFNALCDHMQDGLFCRTIKFFGLIFRQKPTPDSKRGIRGQNCKDREYDNLFICAEDGNFHVYLIPPKEK
jgi:hypothetical protein